MAENTQYEELIQWLKEEGYSEADVEKILRRIRHYEQQTTHDSVMESIAEGRFSLKAIIAEALAEE